MNDKELLDFLENHCLSCCPCSFESSHDSYCGLCDIYTKISELKKERRNDIEVL